MRAGPIHLEVLEGSNGPSALFLQTLISSVDSPRAWVRSAKLSFELLLAAGRPGPPSNERGLARLEERCLPTTDRLLRHLLLASSLADRDLASEVDNTIRIFLSVGITGGLEIEIGSFLNEPIIH